jgi:hypothetical protein
MTGIWIQTHTLLRTNPKLTKLAEELRAPNTEVVGPLLFLWLWAAEFAEDGDLTKFSVRQLAEASMLPLRKAPLYFEALVTTGWLDRNAEENTLKIHDWSDWGISFLAAARSRARASKERKALALTGEARFAPPQVSTETFPERSENEKLQLQNSTEQNRTEHNPTEGRELPPSLEAVADYAKRIGLDENEAKKFFNYFEANGWRIAGHSPMKNWHSAMNSWKLREKDFAPARSSPAATARGNPDAGRMDYLERQAREQAAAAAQKTQRLHCTGEMITQDAYIKHKIVCKTCAEQSEAIMKAALSSLHQMADAIETRTTQAKGNFSHNTGDRR